MSYIEKLNQQKADIFQFYKTVDGLRLPIQVFLPDFFDKTCTYPTVIAIHGGGWNALKETPTDWDGGWTANNVKYYREKGYVGIVFSYRDFAICPDGVGGICSYCAKDPMPYSPVHHIKKLDAKILVMHGTSDSVVAIDDSRVFTDKNEGSRERNHYDGSSKCGTCLYLIWLYQHRRKYFGSVKANGRVF